LTKVGYRVVRSILRTTEISVEEFIKLVG